MKTTMSIAMLLLAGLASAQSLIPIPAYTMTYSYTRTRGYFFQTPVDFTIVQLKVPDEQNHGTQHVAVFKPTARPPAYTATAYTPPLFYGTGPSASKLTCNIPFKKGDWVGILGGCGDTTVMHNSYGASGPWTSNLLGSNISLERFITQTNIASNKGIQALYSSSTGSVGRIEVYVRAGSGATLIGSGSGSPGTSIDFNLKSPSDAGLPYQLGSSLGSGPIKIDTRQIDLSPDDLLVLSVSGLVPSIFRGYTGLLDSTGEATARLNIPNNTALKGTRIYTAFLTLLPKAPSGVASISSSFLFSIL